ncbi:uncharacterized protein LOC112530177 isoform X2 [Gallus gallus]|uniref:uncharacterized protein LOC112530177 isoform X2 n=1 Tax=Gallus gallus TaxID=9031 RepID=UPI001AE4F4B9|nr:uncharacterized protein LOC112530177 isoform X2 [Gallus gallus]
MDAVSRSKVLRKSLETALGPIGSGVMVSALQMRTNLVGHQHGSQGKWPKWRFIGGRCIPLNLKHCNKEDGKPAEPREPGDSKPCSFPGLGALHCAGLSHACAEQRALRPSCPSTVLLPLEAMRNFAEISKAFGEMLWKCAAGGDWSAQGPLSNICAHGQRNPN